MKNWQIVLIIAIILIFAILAFYFISQTKVTTAPKPDTGKPAPPTMNAFAFFQSVMDFIKRKKEGKIKEDISGQLVDEQGYLVDQFGMYVDENGNSVEIPVMSTEIV